MAREHKARLWDEDNKVLSFIDLLDLEATIQALDSFRDYFGATYFRLHPEYWMNFTGWKDKNGKNIYSGDFISEKGSEPYEVVWQAHSGSWIMKSMAYSSGYRGMAYDYAQRDYEVIGNVFENPELLTPNT